MGGGSVDLSVDQTCPECGERRNGRMFRHYYLTTEVAVTEEIVIEVPPEVEEAAREMVELTGYGDVDEEQAYQDSLCDLVTVEMEFVTEGEE
jgi:hypothetical protein